MPIVNKTKRTAAIYNRGREVVKVYDHGKLAWQKSTSIPDYLCFTALEAGQFTLTIPAAVTATYLSYVEWSKDGRNWNHTDNTSDAVTIDVQVASGEKVYWRGSGQCMTPNHTAANNASRFSSTGEFDMSGHLLSLLKGSDYDNLSGIGNYTFCNLFFQSSGSLGVVHAHDLVMPTLNKTGMFFRLFRGCTSLVSAPPLPQTEIPSWGFREMFYGCTSLPTIASMVATTFGNTCCQAMYQGCTSLTSVTLPTPTSYSGTGQFQLMFYNCSNLSYVKFLATDISTENCTYNWLNGVSSTGTFIQAEGVEWPRGASGIPTGWLAYDEGEEIPNDYTPCDYIYNSSQSGGGVDLGFKFRLLDYSVEAKFKQDDISNGMVIGTYTNNSGTIWFYNYSVAGSFRINACYSSGWKYNVNGFVPLDTDTHIIRYVGDADGCYQISDGKQSGIHDISTWAAEESTDRLFIFGRSQSQNTYKGRIYYLKVWNTATEEVICNLIPCSRNSDGAAGFWDTAQKQFFTSAYWTAHNDNE